MKEFDIAVIGGGPAGYVSAIRAAQLKLSVAIIEKRATLGGTCLNVGCIPSKALLDSSEHYENATKHFPEHGIGVKDVKMDVAQMHKRKDKVVSEVTSGVDFLMKKNKIDVIMGYGKLVTPTKLEVTAADGSKQIVEAKNIVIARKTLNCKLDR